MLDLARVAFGEDIGSLGSCEDEDFADMTGAQNDMPRRRGSRRPHCGPTID